MNCHDRQREPGDAPMKPGRVVFLKIQKGAQCAWLDLGSHAHSGK
jgi:hypothetical protein